MDGSSENCMSESICEVFEAMEEDTGNKFGEDGE